MKKRLLSILMAAAIVAGTVGTAAAAGADTAPEGQQPGVDTGYADVDSGNPAAADIKAVTDAGYMNGVGGGNFAPDGTVTRAQAITVLGRLAGAEPQDTDAFSDVPAGTWYSGYVGWAVEQGIVEGAGNGLFDPDSQVTGEHLDLMFERYADGVGLDYINFPAVNGETVTRADMAQRLVKLMNAPVNRDYEDKELWFDTTLYGGFFSPYQIFMGNGDATFDMPAFVNSEHGEKMMSRIKYELALVGDHNWSDPRMIEHWDSLGITQKAYNVGTDMEWLAYIPQYITNDGTYNEKVPVVFCFHGGGGTLFEATDHGFVDLCYDEGFIVICPENQNSNNQLCLENLTVYVQQLEDEGYPVDWDRIYTTGMSMGGMASMYCSVKGADIVAAGVAQGCADYGLLFDGSMYDDYLLEADFEAATEPAPMYFLVGDHEMEHQIPLTDEALEGLNTWLEMNGCTPAERADNVLGFVGDRIYERELDGTTYTITEFDDANGDTTVVFAGIENWVHWTPYSYASLTWDFMSQFTN